MTSAFLDEGFFMETLQVTQDSDISRSQASMNMEFVQNIHENQDSPSVDEIRAHVPGQSQSEARMEVDGRNPNPLQDEARPEREVPDYLEDYWQTAPDRIKRIGFEIHPALAECITPRKSDVNKMYSCSKCFRLIDNESNLLLCPPTQSPAFVYMAECRTEIPSHIQSVLYFFNALSNDISNFQFFALPTKHASISVSLAQSLFGTA